MSLEGYFDEEYEDLDQDDPDDYPDPEYDQMDVPDCFEDEDGTEDGVLLELLMSEEGWVYPQQNWSDEIQGQLEANGDNFDHYDTAHSLRAHWLYAIDLGPRLALVGNVSHEGDFYERLEQGPPNSRGSTNLTHFWLRHIDGYDKEEN